MGLGFARALSGLGSYLGSTIPIMMKTGSLAKLILITLPCPNVGCRAVTAASTDMSTPTRSGRSQTPGSRSTLRRTRLASFRGLRLQLPQPVTRARWGLRAAGGHATAIAVAIRICLLARGPGEILRPSPTIASIRLVLERSVMRRHGCVSALRGQFLGILPCLLLGQKIAQNPRMAIAAPHHHRHPPSPTEHDEALEFQGDLARAGWALDLRYQREEQQRPHVFVICGAAHAKQKSALTHNNHPSARKSGFLAKKTQGVAAVAVLVLVVAVAVEAAAAVVVAVVAVVIHVVVVVLRRWL